MVINYRVGRAARFLGMGLTFIGVFFQGLNTFFNEFADFQVGSQIFFARLGGGSPLFLRAKLKGGRPPSPIVYDRSLRVNRMAWKQRRLEF